MNYVTSSILVVPDGRAFTSAGVSRRESRLEVVWL